MNNPVRVLLPAFIIFILVFIFFGRTFAHEAHKKKKAAPPVTTTQPYTPQSRLTSELIQQQPQEELEQPRDMQTIMREAAMSHFHNKIIHFPLALGITASILIFFANRRPEMIPVIRVLLIVAALFAVAAYFTGKSQEEPFEHGEMEEIVEWHERAGIISGILLWSGVLVVSSQRSRSLLPIYAVLQLIALSITGFFGGILAHG
jgi:uncharacterized membrane protein